MERAMWRSVKVRRRSIKVIEFCKHCRKGMKVLNSKAPEENQLSFIRK